ncbi:uncharacterized protein LOC128652185 [Bombina bombina]|uniref:uncharacterized protein LOC128652185 n=1 Tax=Bombina bombina TaxID=8345 RepID=UPI00235A8C68|nr:uncharacterized protein LOC128652185 [Bombina bombina]
MNTKRLPKSIKPPKTTGHKDNLVEQFFSPTSPKSRMREEADVPQKIKDPAQTKNMSHTEESTSVPNALLSTLASKQDIADIIRSCIREEIAEIKQDLHAVGNRVEALEEFTDNLQEEINTVQEATNHHTAMFEELYDKIEDLENRSRRKNLIIRGIPESVLPKDLPLYLPALFAHLRNTTPTTDIPWVLAHRALRPKPPDTAPPRDIIMKFKEFREKEEILNLSRRNQPVKFRGVVLQFFQDLSQRTLQKRRELAPLTSLLRQKKILYRWGFPFHLYVLHGNRKLSCKSMADTEELCSALDIEPPRGFDTEDSQEPPKKKPARVAPKQWHKVAPKSRSMTPYRDSHSSPKDTD